MFSLFGRRRAAGLFVIFMVAVAAGFALDRYTGSAASWVTKNAVMIRQIAAPNPIQLFGKDHVRVLVAGLDYDYDDKDQETSKHSRTDIIMAVRLDFARHRIDELSVPRDMVAVMPSGQRAKINEAQSEGGIAESQSVVAHWLGIPNFDRYVVLRIDTTKDLIDALGGIDVDVENSDALTHSGPNGPIDYDDSWGHLHVHLKPGKQHLTGAQAVGYARFRHDWCSDPCRIMRQQAVIRSVIDRAERDRLNTVEHAGALLGVIGRDIDTNLTPAEELAAAMTFSHVTAREIHTAQVPYVGTVDLPGYGDSIVPDEKRKRALVASMLLR
jgi:polyisoprenyl-teichoic acid--peptidoglycan teichoic acid transferase